MRYGSLRSGTQFRRTLGTQRRFRNITDPPNALGVALQEALEWARRTLSPPPAAAAHFAAEVEAALEASHRRCALKAAAPPSPSSASSDVVPDWFRAGALKPKPAVTRPA